MDQYLQPDGQPFDMEYVHSVEFSPNGNVLYISRFWHLNLYQYDLSPGNSLGISSTGVCYSLTPWCYPVQGGHACPGGNSSLQLGPDGNIYITNKPNMGLSVMKDPNKHNEPANYQQVPLIKPSNHGLPNFMSSYFNPYAISTSVDACSKLNLHTSYKNAAAYDWTMKKNDSLILHSTEKSPSLALPDSGDYNVELVLTSQHGCSEKIKKKIHVAKCILPPLPPPPPVVIEDIYIPNVFSPNDDNLNDKLIISGLDQYPENKVRIFNRWGHEIYYQENYSSANAFDGKDFQDGVYYFELAIPSIGFLKRGIVTILR
jgi:gliding motility-associated-like protein